MYICTKRYAHFIRWLHSYETAPVLVVHKPHLSLTLGIKSKCSAKRLLGCPCNVRTGTNSRSGFERTEPLQKKMVRLFTMMEMQLHKAQGGLTGYTTLGLGGTKLPT